MRPHPLFALALLVSGIGCPEGSAEDDDGTDDDGGGDDDAGDDDASGDDDGADDDAADDDAAVPSPGRFFPDDAYWYQDFSDAPVDQTSDAVIGWLDAQGWGLGRMQTDFSLELLEAEEDAPFLEFTPTGDFYVPDCDHVPVPVPEWGALESEDGYACEGDGDCHLISVHRASGTLHEMWRADIVGDVFRGGCLAVWDMTRVYGPEGRGDQCTSADAAGYPIAPLLFTADEVAAGPVDHVIRFVLPNSSIRAGVFVHPATHSTGAASGPSTAPPYGAHLRLRADFPLEALPNEAARNVARGLMVHGMLLADGGSVTLTARSDRFTTAKWSDLMDSHAMEAIQPGDFELLELGDLIPLTYDCVRVR